VKISGVRTFLVEYEKFVNPVLGEEQPGTSTYGRISKTQHVILRVATDEGIEGVGEAMNFTTSRPPLRHLRQTESAATVSYIVKQVLAPALVGLDPCNPDAIHALMDGWVSGHPSAKAAVDMACFDIAARSVKQPLHELLGGSFRKEAPGIGGVRLAEPARMARVATAWVDAGWRGIQVKLGGLEPDPDSDVDRVRTVREAVGDETKILADFNQAYEADQALEVVKRLEKYDVYIEQPTPAWDIDGLSKVAHSTALPVIADEAVTFGDPVRNLIKIAESGAAACAKLKDMGTGGLTVQRRLMRVASKYRMSLIPDADGVCTRVSDTALAQVTAALNDPLFFITAAGTTSQLLSPDVVSRGGVRVSRGIVTVPQGVGLGLEVDWSLLREI
jgi:L-Ala-D/L-Glu epimerase / N-acetyl-D-glutamate racemase